MRAMNPEDIFNVTESHNCSGCDKLVVEIEFKNGERVEQGCHCEIGGESGE